jgi:hypothetical protein
VFELGALDSIAGDVTILESAPLDEAYQHPGYWRSMDTICVIAQAREELSINGKTPWKD